MTQIKVDLPQTYESVSDKNKLSSYFPIRTKDRKGAFDWDTVIGFVIKLIYNKETSLSNTDEFRERCKSVFIEKLDDKDFWTYLEKMYFDNNGIFKIAPEFLLFKAIQTKGNKPNTRLGEMFASLLQGVCIKGVSNARLNFLEQNMVDILYDSLKDTDSTKSKNINEQAYLPFLSQLMQNDIQFLSKHPKYFLNVLSQFLRIYAYLYTAQLALNIGSWREGEPSPKPLYFILDFETASLERTHIRIDGHQRVHQTLYKIFPYLAMSESIQNLKVQKQPIWKIAQDFQNTSYDYIKNFAEAFKIERKLTYSISNTGELTDILNDLLNLGMKQFSKGQSRHEINNTYVKAIESELCDHFIQSRGRSGKVLVINQDYLLLLTNISIGDLEQLRFHELLMEFRKRGIFFDKKSQQALIQFYERIGNVERMSDSGDAVYVRKTI